MGSNGEIVETDETIVGGKTQNKNKAFRKKVKEGKIDPMSNKSIVMGIIQRKGELQLEVIQGRAQILPTVSKVVSKDASLITDSSTVYKSIDKLYSKHRIIDHSNDEYAKGVVHTNTIEGAFSLFDRMIIGIYHYASPKHLQRYCDEFMFRYNNRQLTDIEKFGIAIKRGSNTRLDYKTLIS